MQDERLALEYPDAVCELDHRNAFELLAATILSAQSTDARVNMVTPALFARYPDAEALAAAEPTEFEEIIHSTGFFRAKARSLMGMATELVERFDGQVPGAMAEWVARRRMWCAASHSTCPVSRSTPTSCASPAALASPSR